MTDKGVWSFDPDTGEFVLAEPWASMLAEIKAAAAVSFNETMYSKLAAMSGYTVDELQAEWHRRVLEESLSPIERTDEFIVEALTGEL